MQSEHSARSVPPEDDAAEERAWCVDRGATLTAMSTDELLRAISIGEISAASRVWCEGLDGWTRISDVPEIASLFSFEADLATLPAVEIASPTGFSSRGAPTPELSQFDTPSAAPVARPVSSSDGRAARRKTNLDTSRRRMALGGDAFWIGGGLCVAAAAIGVALFQSPSLAAPPREFAEHRLTSVEAMARAASAGLPPVIDRATLSRSEPGQRRLRGGAGRPNRR
jgi:hypothetical protein